MVLDVSSTCQVLMRFRRHVRPVDPELIMISSRGWPIYERHLDTRHILSNTVSALILKLKIILYVSQRNP